jgi:hypothetical protein
MKRKKRSAKIKQQSMGNQSWTKMPSMETARGNENRRSRRKNEPKI